MAERLHSDADQQADSSREISLENQRLAAAKILNCTATEADTLIPIDEAAPGDELLVAWPLLIAMGYPDKGHKRFVAVDLKTNKLVDCNQADTWEDVHGFNEEGIPTGIEGIVSKARYWFAPMLRAVHHLQ